MKIPNLPGQTLESAFDRSDFGIYIHVPFCMRRCRYCAFVSSTPRSIPEQAYAQAVMNEFDLRYPNYADLNLKTLYFGGGTPTMLSDATIGKIVETIANRYDTPDEITLEANPEHITQQRCENWHSIGFTRISLGIQSFDTQMLQFLGRRHDRAQALAAIDHLHAAGFEEISIDLIYGGLISDDRSDAQALASWRHDLETAGSCAAAHVSCYELTLEPHTPLWTRQKRGQKVLCDESTIAEMMTMIPQILCMTRYEISNYSRDDYYSAHNLSCWAGLSYLGLGAAAHSLFASPKRFMRKANTANIKDYVSSLNAAHPTLPDPEFTEDLSPQTHLAERLMCAARTRIPFNPCAIASQIGADISPYLDGLEKAMASGLIERQRNGAMRTTERGILLNNRLDALIFEGCPDN